MKKVLLLIAVLSISIFAYSQKKDTTAKPVQPPQPKLFVLVGVAQGYENLEKILMQSVLSLDSKTLTASEVLNIVQWLRSRKEIGGDPPKK